MEKEHRIRCALEHVADRSVFIVRRADWERMVLPSGEPTRLERVPGAIAPLVSMAAHVMAAGSGVVNPSPGIDVVRYDAVDAPYVYNTDHYAVFEDLLHSPLYGKSLHIAQVERSEDLDKTIQAHVFVVGPYREGNHWEEEIPKEIQGARSRDSGSQ